MQLFNYKSADLFRIVVCYAPGIGKNHPFLNGNQRADSLAAAIFLETNSWISEASEKGVVNRTGKLAEGGNVAEGYAVCLKRNSRPSEADG